MIPTIFRSMFLLGLIALGGCSFFQADKQTLNITCTQQDVVLKVNGDTFPCPSKVEVRRDSKVLLEANKVGFEPYIKAVDYHLSTAGKWDIFGTVCWFFPVFGLTSSGAWSLDQTDFDIQLYALASKN
jgi:hypothetical protein